MELLGWLIWGGAALLTIYAVQIGLATLFGLRQGSARAGWIFSAPFLFFSVVTGTALWLTAAQGFSKFHLLWSVPAAVLASMLFGMSNAMRQFQRMSDDLQSQLDRATSQQQRPESSGKETVVLDPEDYSSRQNPPPATDDTNGGLTPR